MGVKVGNGPKKGRVTTLQALRTCYREKTPYFLHVSGTLYGFVSNLTRVGLILRNARIGAGFQPAGVVANEAKTQEVTLLYIYIYIYCYSVTGVFGNSPEKSTSRTLRFIFMESGCRGGGGLFPGLTIPKRRNIVSCLFFIHHPTPYSLLATPLQYSASPKTGWEPA